VDTGRNPSMVIAGSMLIRWMGTQDIQLLRNHQVQVEMHERLGTWARQMGLAMGMGPCDPYVHHVDGE